MGTRRLIFRGPLVPWPGVSQASSLPVGPSSTLIPAGVPLSALPSLVSRDQTDPLTRGLRQPDLSPTPASPPSPRHEVLRSSVFDLSFDVLYFFPCPQSRSGLTRRPCILIPGAITHSRGTPDPSPGHNLILFVNLPSRFPPPTLAFLFSYP